jgi:hypothetical protein
VSTPVTAIGESDPADQQLRITYHPSFAAGAKQTITMLRTRLRRHEEIFQELYVVFALPEDTNCDDLPVLAELELRSVAGRR